MRASAATGGGGELKINAPHTRAAHTKLKTLGCPITFTRFLLPFSKYKYVTFLSKGSLRLQDKLAMVLQPTVCTEVWDEKA